MEPGGDERAGWGTRQWMAVPVGFLAASIPFSYLMARAVRDVDLRSVGTGTVSGTGLYEVAGFGPLAVAGVLEVAKGAVGPLLAGRGHPGVGAAATAPAVAGHNWSPWLGGAGGRGLSPAIGALAVTAPAAAVTLLAGMAGGRLAGETAIGSLIGDVVAVPVAAELHGRPAMGATVAAVAVMVAKRLAGNRPLGSSPRRAYLWRMLLDRDTRKAPVTAVRAG